MKTKLILCLLLFLTLKSHAQINEIPYENYFNNEGLYSPFINNIIQDTLGLLWLSGYDGLYKFNGGKISQFPYEYKNQEKKNDKVRPVKSISLDPQHNIIWMATDSGISVFDCEKEKGIELIRNSRDNKCIQVDQKGCIWISKNPGLMRLSPKRKLITTKDLFFKPADYNYNIEEFYFLPSNRDSSINVVENIYMDAWGNLWFLTPICVFVKPAGDFGFRKVFNFPAENMIRLNENDLIISSYPNLIHIKDFESISGKSGLELKNLNCNIIQNKPENFPLCMDAGKDGTVYFGTSKNTYCLEITGKGKYIVKPLLKDRLKEEPSFIDVYSDRTGILWAGTSKNGLIKINVNHTQVTSYKNITEKYIGVADINSIWKDSNENLWVGTYGNGLFKISKDYRVKNFSYPLKESTLCASQIKADNYWIGTSAGIFEVNCKTGNLTDPIPGSMTKENLNRTLVWEIMKVDDLVYIATQNGLFIYDFLKKKLNQFTRKDTIPGISDRFMTFLKTQQGDVWASSAKNQLNQIKYNPQKEKLEIISFKDSLLDGGQADVLFQDKSGFIWIGCNKGLKKVDLVKRKTFHYPILNIYNYQPSTSIVESNDFLWIGNYFGLCRYNKSTGQTKVLNKDDGIPIVIHNHHSCFQDEDGKLYFGGVGGFYSFYPDSIKTSAPSRVIITEFRLFNKPVAIDTSINGILKKHITYTDELELSHKQNDISFEFTTLDFDHPLQYKFKYKLDGYQDKWIETDGYNTTATYTNLKPGNYTFRVNGANSFGIWNKQDTTVEITILSPWWATWFALCVYIALVIASVLGFVKWRLWRISREKIELEQLVKTRSKQIEEQKEEIYLQKELLEQKTEQIIQLDQLKSRFFSNISHEFRTPLALIQMPVEDWLKDNNRSEKDRKKLNLIKRNTNRLLTLTNQLLDISKIDSGNMNIELIETDPLEHLRALAGIFYSLAEAKSIHYICSIPGKKFITLFDPDKLEKIFINILSNAFKFTPEGGEIIVKADIKENVKESRTLIFSVTDDGPGIPEESLNKIFDRFYQVEEAVKNASGGTGIGLSLVNDMINLLHGRIEVSSVYGKGSTFTVTLPLGKDHFQKTEYTISKTKAQIKGNHSAIINSLEYPEYAPYTENDSRKELPLVLIVEDNYEMRSQLTESLCEKYQVKEAVDGFSGLKKAIENIPDLILTDLMMPRMDGIELCRKIRENENTSHIPVILLTAKAAFDDKLEGLHAGADDYVAKPFSMEELKMRIDNLIESRIRLRERFSKEITLDPKDITITSMDEKFLNKAIEIVEKHMHEENFSMTDFRKEMNMSRSTLFRKIYALTNQSPTEFIRTIRLKRAMMLLKQNYGNISEIAFEVGFSNLSYFSRSFKQLFNVSPANFIKHHQPG